MINLIRFRFERRRAANVSFRAEEGGGGARGVCVESFRGKKEKKRERGGEMGSGRGKNVLLFLFLFLTHESVIRKKKIKTLCKNENCLALFFFF